MKTVCLATILAATVLAIAASAQTWQGRFDRTDSTLRVVNPATPMQPPETIEAEELWRIGDDEDHVLGRVTSIVVGDGKTYMLDAQIKEVAVYDADGCFLTTLGREGDGPGEFRYPRDILVTDEGVVGVAQLRSGQIMQLASNGDPLPGHPLPEPDHNGRFYLLGAAWTPEWLVVHQYQRPMTDDGGLISIDALVAIDADGDEVTRYCERITVRRYPDNKRVEGEYEIFPALWEVGSCGQVVVCDRYDAYELTMYEPRGDVDRLITRDYEPRRRGREATQAYQDYLDEKWAGRRWRGNIGPVEYVVNDCDRDIQMVTVREDGGLWVLPSHGAHDGPLGELGTFDVFDNEGRFVRQVTLRGEGDFWTDHYIVSRDHLFVVTNTGEEIPGFNRPGAEEGVGDAVREIICYRLPR